MSAARLRAGMLLMSLSLGILWILSRYMAPLRDVKALAVQTAVCCAWTLYRGTHKRARKDDFAAWVLWYGTPMRRHPWNHGKLHAAFAWAVLDSFWLGTAVTAGLPWGILGVFCILFQGLFLAGFAVAERERPDLYDSGEKAQSMDMLEHLLYAQAQIVLLCAAWLRTQGIV